MINRGDFLSKEIVHITSKQGSEVLTPHNYILMMSVYTFASRQRVTKTKTTIKTKELRNEYA